MRLENIFLGLASATTVLAAPNLAKRAGFTFTGVNVAGGEFGNKNLPGQLGKDYTWPSKPAIDQLIKDRMNIFRVAFMMERVIPSKMTGTVNETYFAGLLDVSFRWRWLFDIGQTGSNMNFSLLTTLPESEFVASTFD
jgi:endoglucanase